MARDQPIECVGELLFTPRHCHAIAEDVLVHRRIDASDAVEQHAQLHGRRGERVLGVAQCRTVDRRDQRECVGNANWLQSQW